MANKPTLKKIEQIANNEEAAVALFNDNFNTLEEAIKDSVSRSGKVPTNMLDNLDMGDKRIINLGKAVGDNDAVRYKDVKDALKESQNAKMFAQNAENAAIRADASAALADTSKREAQEAEAGAKTSEDNAQMIYDELITDEAVATVHENIADVKTVAADIGNVNTTADNIEDVKTVAADIDNVNTTATNIEDVKTVAADIDNVNTTATNIEDIKAVFDIAKRICYGNIGDISATAANIAPDGCRFLDGATITREEFPDAFKMLDEGTLPATPVADYNAATEVDLPYTVTSGSPIRYGSVLTIPATTDIVLKTTAAIPSSSATKVFRTKVKVTATPLPTTSGGYSLVDFAFGGLRVKHDDADGSGFKFGFSYFLSETTNSGVYPSTNVFERDKWYTIESTLNGTNIENKIYDGSVLIETVLSHLNDQENFTRSEFLVENHYDPIVYDIDLASTQLVLDDVSYFNGTIVEPQGSIPFFGFDAGTDVAYLPVAKDIFLEAGDVHAALVSAGLPGLEGSVTQALLKDDATFSGVFSKSTVGGNAQDTSGSSIHRYDVINFDASTGNPIYGNSDTVQPEALKYRHYIVLSHREQMIFTMRDSVKAYKDLPTTGNINGDIRMVTDQGTAYIWCRYSRDVWGWSSIGTYLTITAPGKFAWGTLGGDLRAQTDLYERLQIPSRAIAGSGVLFSEEKGINYKEYLPSGDTGPFGFSEDGTYLTSCPIYGTLMLDQIDFTKDFTCNVRIAGLNEQPSIVAGSLGFQNYITLMNGDLNSVVRLAVSPFISLTFPSSSSLIENEVDIRISVKAGNITLSAVLPSTGEVLGEVTQAATLYNPVDALYLGNRPRAPYASSYKINLKGTWVEQDGVKTFAYEDIEDPKTVIEVEDYAKIMKNVSKGSSVVLTRGNTEPTHMGSTAYGFGSVNYINNAAIGFGSQAYSYGQKGGALGFLAQAFSEGSFQIGEGKNKEAFTLQFRDTPIVVENKLASASLPLVAGEGITLEAGAPRKAYHVVGSPQVNDSILTIATTEDLSYLMSDPREYSPRSLRAMTIQLALKNVGVNKGSSTSYSSDYLFRFTAPFAYSEEEGTKYNNWDILRVVISESSGIRVSGILSGAIAFSKVEGKDVLLEWSIANAYPWARTLRYSVDDGASWTIVSNVEEPAETYYVYYPTLQIGRCVEYYGSYGHFTGSFDLSKTFFTDLIRDDNSFNFEMTKPSNELVISADIPEDIGGGEGYRSLNETQKVTALNEGTYDGVAIESGEVFTEYDGKFVEFSETPTESEPPVQTTLPVAGVIIAHGGRAVLWPYSGTTGYYSDNKGASWNAITVPAAHSTSRPYFKHNGSVWLYQIGKARYVSSDGISWSSAGSFDYQYVPHLLTFKGRFYAWVQEKIWHSENGVSWTEDTSPTTGNIALVARENDLLLFDQTGSIYSSTDGASWSLLEQKHPYTDLSSVYTDYVLGVVWMRAKVGSSYSIRYSTDLSVWTQNNIGAAANMEAFVTQVNDSLAVSGGSSSYYYTNDGISWTQGTLSASAQYLHSAATSDGTFYLSQERSKTAFIGKAGTSYSFNDLSYTKAEVDAAVAGATPDLTGYLKNTATGNYALTINATQCPHWGGISIGTSASVTNSGGIAIGLDAEAAQNALAIGPSSNMGSTNQYNARATGDLSIAIGYNAQTFSSRSISMGYKAYAAGTSGVCIGDSSYANAYSTAVGYSARAGSSAIQIGQGTNNTANTMNVGLSSSLNVQLLDASGNIPGERMSLQGTTAPTTSTVGSIGQFYVDTATGTGYMCVGVADDAYTWKQITV